ncbi:hypothetical protein GA0061070_106021 [Kosakonia oryziphila]|uniref:Uncharacterized protein n=1 Tax=Kosakonia oryziphila TaxID=1005667 RepID=A0A1C4GB83_9ENTR|nr:hypothetical protein GA0061070_106021 [Kosakonia oryziphila]
MILNPTGKRKADNEVEQGDQVVNHHRLADAIDNGLALVHQFRHADHADNRRIFNQRKILANLRLGKFVPDEFVAASPPSCNSNMTSNAINNSSRQVSQRTDVRIDNIEIQTQATDAKDIVQEIPGNIKDATWHFDDGLRA